MNASDGVPQTSGRRRISALADAGSVLEIGGRARSQQADVADRTPADGLHTAFATVGGAAVMIVAESPDALAHTDAEVARAKLHRTLSLARDRSLPVVVIADGPTGAAPGFAPAQGELHGRMADPRDAISPHTLTIAVLAGPLTGPARELAGAADITLGTVGDIDAADAREVLITLLQQTPSASYLDVEVVDVAEPEVYGVGMLIADETPLAFTDTGALRRSVVRVGGVPLLVVAAGAPLAHADLTKLGRSTVLAHKLGWAMLLVQDCPGYSDTLAADVHALAAHSAVVRGHPGLRIGLVVGDGHVLGTFALGGRRIDLDLIFAWPGARLAVTDPLTHSVAALDDARRPDPWLAAGLGLIDDVITPGETRGVLRRVLALAANTKGRHPNGDT